MSDRRLCVDPKPDRLQESGKSLCVPVAKSRAVGLAGREVPPRDVVRVYPWRKAVPLPWRGEAAP